MNFGRTHTFKPQLLPLPLTTGSAVLHPRELNTMDCISQPNLSSDFQWVWPVGGTGWRLGGRGEREDGVVLPTSSLLWCCGSGSLQRALHHDTPPFLSLYLRPGNSNNFPLLLALGVSKAFNAAHTTIISPLFTFSLKSSQMCLMLIINTLCQLRN